MRMSKRAIHPKQPITLPLLQRVICVAFPLGYNVRRNRIVRPATNAANLPKLIHPIRLLKAKGRLGDLLASAGPFENVRLAKSVLAALHIPFYLPRDFRV